MNGTDTRFLFAGQATSLLTMARAHGESPTGSEVDGAESLNGSLELSGDGLVLDQDILDATSSLAISNDVDGGGINPPAPEASLVRMVDLSGLSPAPSLDARDRLISTTLTVDLSRIRLLGLPAATLASANLILHPEGTSLGLNLSLGTERETPVAERGVAVGGSLSPGIGFLVSGGYRRSSSGSVSATPRVSGGTLLSMINQRSVVDVNENLQAGNLRMRVPHSGELSEVSAETDDENACKRDSERQTATKGGASSASQVKKVKTPAQLASKAAKRRRRRDRQLASKAASKEAAALALPLENLEVTDGARPTAPNGGDRKRTSVASGPPAKKSKLESSQAARDMAGWIAGESDFSQFSEEAKHSPIHRNTLWFPCGTSP